MASIVSPPDSQGAPIPQQPRLDDSGTRLLAAFDAQPIRLPERQRLINAFDLVTGDQWTRVLVRFEPAQLDSLARPGSIFILNEAHYIFEVATSLAVVYEFETVSVGLVAVALALTMHENHKNTDVPAGMAEIYLGAELDHLDKALAQHGARMEALADAAVNGPEVDTGLARSNRRGRKATVVIHLALHCAATLSLVLLAVLQHSPIAWVIAALSLFSSRDRREPSFEMTNRVSPFEFSTSWPLFVCWAMIAAGFGLKPQAMILVATWILLEGISIVGESIEARGFALFGAALRRNDPAFRAVAGVPARFLAGRRANRWGTALAFALIPLGIVAIALTTIWPLYLAVTILIARRKLVLGLIAAADLWLFVHAPLPGALLAIVIGALGLAVLTARGRYARSPAPLPAIAVAGGARGSWTYWRAFRRVALGEPEVAVRLLTRHPRSDPSGVALLAWAYLETDEPALARREALRLPASMAQARHLILCRSALMLADVETAEAEVDRYVAARSQGPLQPKILRAMFLVGFEVDLAAGNPGGLAPLLMKHMPRQIDRSNALDALRIIRLSADALRETEPLLAAFFGGMAVGLAHAVNSTWSDRIATSARNRIITIETARASTSLFLASLGEESFSPDTVEDMLGPVEGASGALRFLNKSVEAANVLDRMADRFDEIPTLRRRALDLRIEALAILNSARHRFDRADDRQSWWKVFGRCLEAAIEQAARGRDWETLAELIETARLQTAPEQESGSRATAPFVRVRSVSQLESSDWYAEGAPARVFEIESMAQSVLGEDVWWWSSWATTTHLYWSVVPPTGRVTGGSWHLANDGIADTLAALRDALPIRYEGESDFAYDDRIRYDSPLSGDSYEQEQELARRLGALVPHPIVAALATEPHIALAIAPAPLLSTVPWATVAIASPGAPRLIERATIAIAPPSALLARIVERGNPVSESLPASLAVVNPTGDLVVADRLKESLDTSIMLRSRAELGVTLDDLGEALRSLHHHSTFVVAAHTAPGPDGGAALLLEAGVPPQLLTADDLIRHPDRVPMPRQVVLLACESADLAGAVTGEWLTLGPATLWAGADRALVTSFPLLEDRTLPADAIDTDRLVMESLSSVDSLASTLRTIQLSHLAAWRSSNRGSAPVFWAGHIAMGVFAEPRMRLDLTPHRDFFVNESLAHLIDNAAAFSLGRGKDVVDASDIAASLTSWGFEDEIPAWRRPLVRAAYWSQAIGPRLGSRGDRSNQRARSLAPDAIALLEQTLAIARYTRHRSVDVEHLLAAFLQSESREASIARTISGWDARVLQVVRTLVTGSQRGLLSPALPTIRHLSPEAVTQLYTAFAKPVPRTDLERIDMK